MKIKKVVKKAKRSGTSKIPLLRRALPVILVVVFSAVTLLAVLPLLPKKPLQSTPKHYQGVIELWNVESFEGGIGSRATWLTQRAAKFESTHEGLFVHVTTLTESQLEQKLAEGESFDLISFSRGVGAKVQSYLQPYTASVAGIRENFLVSGQVGAKVYALPYYCGVYCLFARTSQLHQNADLLSTALVNTFTRKVGKHTYNLQPLICGFTPHNSPLTALAMSGGQGEIAPDESVTQYSAYEKFLANTTAVTLLGTQRDMYRLAKREQSGKIENLTFYPLYGYTDLVQCIWGCPLRQEKKRKVAWNFCNSWRPNSRNARLSTSACFPLRNTLSTPTRDTSLRKRDCLPPTCLMCSATQPPLPTNAKRQFPH